MGKKNIWVVPRRDGDWQVKREGAEKATRVVPTKAEAEKIARDLGRRDKVEVTIQKKDGTIQSSDTYGHDESPPVVRKRKGPGNTGPHGARKVVSKRALKKVAR